MSKRYSRVVDHSAREFWVEHVGDRLHMLAHAPWTSLALTSEVFADEDVRHLAPATPSKIVCVGRNYAAHAKEMGNELPKEPLLFFKPPSSIVGQNQAIVLPRISDHVELEAELGVIIGTRCRKVSPEEAMSFVFGYTCVNDVTARDLQKRDGQWARAKGCDTFCAVGPSIVTGLDPRTLRVRCLLNGAVKQDAPTTDMVFDVAAIVSHASQAMTLEPGDLIATGTPDGVARLAHGDVVVVAIEGVGELSNPVKNDE